jgi:diguanylate cyclase (GGDEF)-like protein
MLLTYLGVRTRPTMTIDLPTILLLELTTSLIAALLLATASHSEGNPGLSEARAAMLALVPAFALQLARGHAAEALVIVGANVLFWLSSALIVASYARFAGAERMPRWPFVVVAVAGVVFAVLWTTKVHYGVRAIFTSVMIAGLLTAAFMTLVRDAGLRREPARRVSCLLIALVALPMWLRVFVLLPQLHDDLDPLKPSLETVLGFLPAVLLVQGFALAFLLMQRERGEALARTQAVTDPLTGVLNRRALEDRVRSELAYQERSRRSFSVLVLDLDHFKKVNDHHGHATGDAVLVHTATLLRRLMRPSDIVARYGGEEFCLLLRDTDNESAAAVAHRVCTLLRGEPFVSPAATFNVTASVGVATAAVGETWESLFRRADEALYRAKHEGRDRFVLASLALSPSPSSLPPSPSPGPTKADVGPSLST